MVYLWAALGFFVLAIVAAAMGYGGVAGLPMDIAKWLVVIFTVLAVVAIVLPAPAEPVGAEAVVGEEPSGDINRIIDEEANVVCYAYDKGYGAGIDCLPIDETALPSGGGS